MDQSITRYGRLKAVLENNVIPSKSTAYHIIHVDEISVIFAPTKTTGKVMLPTDLVLEWIAAYEFGIINFNMETKELRRIINQSSEWANHFNGWDTHFRAILKAWINQ